MLKTCIAGAAAVLGAVLCAGAEVPLFESRAIFPPEHWHNHGSCLVETRRGDLLAVWFHGSGERKADDVRIEGARLRRGAKAWGPRSVWADTEGYPDTNCCLFIDAEGRLWLMWPTILANLWESSLMKYRISESFEGRGQPKWSRDGVLHVTPGPEFEEAIARWVPEVERQMAGLPLSAGDREEVERYLSVLREKAGDKLYRRLGWMTRAHPVVADGGRIVVPLYHDGFSCSLMVLSDDGGMTWRTTAPLLGGGNIQPALARRRDGTWVAFMRDNGPAPGRVMESESRDNGSTWSPVRDGVIPNPGAGVDVVVLRDGRWLFVGNDLEDGRRRLVAMLSEDEGRTWGIRRAIEDDAPGRLAGRYHYPSVIQARDGTVHVTYSRHLSTEQELPLDASGKPAHGTIQHVQFNLAWLEAGGR